MPQAANTVPFRAQGDDTPEVTPNPPTKANYEKLVLGLIPFTPVQFSGPDSLLAWGRLAGYGLLAYATYNKIRPVAYAAMGAAAVALCTSLTAKAWAKK